MRNGPSFANAFGVREPKTANALGVHEPKDDER
jgi:hypothetical protein